MYTPVAKIFAPHIWATLHSNMGLLQNIWLNTPSVCGGVFHCQLSNYSFLSLVQGNPSRNIPGAPGQQCCSAFLSQFALIQSVLSFH